jgi:hypothetical protein
VVGEEVFHAHGLRDGVFSHRHALAACEIIPGDGGVRETVESVVFEGLGLNDRWNNVGVGVCDRVDVAY